MKVKLRPTMFSVLILVQLWMMASVSSVQPQTAPQSADAMTSTRELVDRAMVILRDPRLSLTDKRRELRQLAERRFDFPDMARAAMNPHWNGLSPDQRTAYVKGFTAFIEDAYLNKIQDYSGQDIQFIKETSDGPGGAVVHTSVVKSGDEPIALNFRLRQQNGQWEICDLVIDDISIIGSYRAQFARVLNDKGFDALITVLMQKQQELDALLGKQSAN
jgi:phospholipid transport system substrate-binding protein